MDLSTVFTKEILSLPGSSFRLIRIIDNAHFERDVRFQACKLMLQKAVAETNLDMYERIKRILEDKILISYPEDKRPALPAGLDDPNW